MDFIQEVKKACPGGGQISGKCDLAHGLIPQVIQVGPMSYKGTKLLTNVTTINIIAVKLSNT